VALIVGEAEVIIRANTAGLDAELGATDLGAGGLTSKAATAGEDAGLALTGGVKKETGKLGADVAKDGEDAGGMFAGALSKPLSSAKSMLSGLGVPEAVLTGWGAAGVAVAAIGAASIDAAMKMQTADATISTSEGITVKAATNVGDAMLGTSGKSEYSGQQMAVAFGAVAGQLKATQGSALTTAQSMQVMNAASDLATAKQIDLGTATSTVAGVMQAFQLKTGQAAMAADTLFNISNVTGQGVDTVGSALEKLKAKLGDTSPPLGALGALMVDMTKQGITGRAALTGVNTAMTGLIGAATGTTTANLEAKQALQSYGISAVQANGQLTPMSTIIAELGPKFRTMTQAQQLTTASTIFGTSAAKDMVTVINGGPAVYDAASNEVNKMGTAHQAAAVQTDTLRGTFETLKSAVSDFGTQLGQELMPIVTQIMGLFDQLIPIVGTLLKAAFVILTPIIKGTVSELQGLTTAIRDVVTFVTDVFEGKWSAAWDSIKSDFDGVVTDIEQGPQKIVALFTSLPASLKTAMEDVVDAIEQPFIDAFNLIIKAYDDTLGHLPGFLGGGHVNAIASTFSTAGAQRSEDSATTTGDIRGALGGSTSAASGLVNVNIASDATKKGTDAYKAVPTGSTSGGTSATASTAAAAALKATLAALKRAEADDKATASADKLKASTDKTTAATDKAAKDTAGSSKMTADADTQLSKAAIATADAFTVAAKAATDAGDKTMAEADKEQAATEKRIAAADKAEATRELAAAAAGAAAAVVAAQAAAAAAAAKAATVVDNTAPVDDTTTTDSTAGTTDSSPATLNVNFAPGTVQITVQGSIDATALDAVDKAINNALLQLANELQSGINPLSPVAG
jgi:TP901 family phage tail tape measure protein